MMTQSHKNQAGFTMMEMVIVIFLFSVLLVGLLNIFDWQQKIYNLEQADIAATGTAREVMNDMTFAIAQGAALINTRNISGTDYTTGSSSIVIQVPAFDSSGNWLSGQYDYIVFVANGNTITSIIEASSNSARKSISKQLTNYLDSLVLSYNNGDPASASQVAVNLTTKSNYRGNNSVRINLQETIFLRNR